MTFTCSKSVKKHWVMCQIYWKLTNKDTRMTSGALFVNLEHILYFILCYYCWIQTNKCRLCLRNSSFRQKNLFPVTGRNIFSYRLGKFFGLHVFKFIHPAKCWEMINFPDSASKRYVKSWDYELHKHNNIRVS